MDELLSSILPKLLDYGVKVLGVLVGLWLAFRVAAWIQGRVVKSLQKRKFDEALTLFFGSLARWGIILIAVSSCLGVFGVEATSFAAVIGAAGLAIGLAFQGTLSNFAAGVMLLTFRPFNIGDYIKSGGEDGIVAEIGLFVTSLDTLDNKRVILPNSAVVGGNIVNVTHHEQRRVDIDVGVDYGADLQQVRAVLEKAAASIEGRTARGHQVFLVSMGASSVDFQVRVWCNTADYWDVWDRTTQAVKEALDAANISIPFPQMDVHLDKSA
ncbi:MAG: mechanosensitive ion channel family protein [Nannocystaceae bacterium]|nr:mechanosensitive ion channel [bacterium]